MWKRSDGFTLLEVMVALSIIAITLVVVGGLRNRDIVYHHEIRQIVRATLLAQERMTDTEMEENIINLGESSGQFEEPYEEYHWVRSVVPTPFEFAWEVRIMVRWGLKPHESVQLVSYVLEESKL
jgi:general secretion pathway protein I